MGTVPADLVLTAFSPEGTFPPAQPRPLQSVVPTALPPAQGLSMVQAELGLSSAQVGVGQGTGWGHEVVWGLGKGCPGGVSLMCKERTQRREVLAGDTACAKAQ